MNIQVCPVHADESVLVPSPKGLAELTGIAAELGLDVELPRVPAGFPGV
jgi:hypothetical protein